MAEWPYLMLCEGLVFLLAGAGTVILQNTLTGVSYYTYPVLVCAVLGTTAACWVLGVVSLVFLASMDSDFGDGLSSSMLRGARACCGVVMLHMAFSGGLCALNSDPDMCIAMLTGNHLFPSEGALMYHIFAVIFVLLAFTVIVCVLVAVHSMLRSVNRRTFAKPVSRVSWNVNLVLVALFETEVTVDHNTANAFATRSVYVSWQTLIAVPALLVMDILCAKFVVVSREGVVWARIMVVILHLLVLGGWAVLLLLHPVVRSRDTMFVNMGAGAIQVLCSVFDVANVLSHREDRARQAKSSAGHHVLKTGERATSLLEMPVRSGVQHVMETRIYRRPPIDLRKKKVV